MDEASLADGSGRGFARRALGAQYGATVIGLLATVFLNLLLARLLGPDGFGIFGAALALQHLLLVAQDGGFRTLIFRESARESEGLGLDRRKAFGFGLGQALTVTVIASAVALAIAALSPGLLDRLGLPIILAAFAGGFAKAFSGFVSGAMMGQGRFGTEAAWQGGVRIVLLAAGAGTAWASPSPLAVLVALAFVQFALCLPLMRRIEASPPRLARQRAVLAFSARMTLMAGMVALYFRAGTVLLVPLGVDLAEIGRFVLAHRLLDTATLFMGPLAQFVFFRARKGTIEASPRQIIVLAVVWVVLSTFGAWFAFTFGGDILAVLAGEAYRQSGDFLGWLAIAFGASAPNYILMQLLIARDREGTVLRATIVTAIAALIGTTLAILMVGAVGAAVAIAGSELLLLALLARFFGRGRS